MPSLAQEVNKDGFSPIHLATAAGHLEIVKELLEKGGIFLCLLKDKEGRTPLHHAAITGRIQIIEEILSRCPQTIDQVTTLGETAPLLAVKHCKFEAFKVLFEKSKQLEKHEERMNAKDNEGNAILELARATNQLQVTEFLEQTSRSNHQAITMEEVKYTRILKAAYSTYKTTWRNFYDEKVIPIVASLIVQTTYQAAVNPPPSIWKEGMHLDTKCFMSLWSSKQFSLARVDFYRSCPAYGYYRFMGFVVLAFTSSLLLIPFHGNNWVTISLMSACLFSLLMTVRISVGTTSSSNNFNDLVFGVVVVVGIGSLICVPVLSLMIKFYKYALEVSKGGRRSLCLPSLFRKI